MALRKPWLLMASLMLIAVVSTIPTSEAAHWIVIAALLTASATAGIRVRHDR